MHELHKLHNPKEHMATKKDDKDPLLTVFFCKSLQRVGVILEVNVRMELMETSPTCKVEC